MNVHSLRTADATAGAVYRSELRRQAWPWSIGMLLVSWPIPMLTGLLLYRLGDLLATWAAFAVPASWLAYGLVLLLLPTPLPDPIGPGLRPHPELPRRPTAAEAETLDPAWRAVTRTIGLAEGPFSLWVRDTPGPMGVAHPAGFVIVSTRAVHELSTAELRGVLGHEIGHRVGDGGGACYRLSWLYSGLLRMWFGVAASGASWLTRRWPRLQIAAAAITQLGVLTGLVALLHLLFGTAAAVMLPVAAAAQMGGQRAVLRRNQYNADRVSVDLGGGPGLRSYLLRTTRSTLYPRRYLPLRNRMVLRCLEVCSTDPWPDRRIAALGVRMLGNPSRPPDLPRPGWLARLVHAVLAPLGRLLYWSITAPTLNPFAGRRIPDFEPRPYRRRRRRHRSRS
ncbi:M48 family metalloprotease [Nocardia sp. NPDC059240]|uniref:M48 family metalloprotease n=1 Tax=Nocardia sp. NPDC059240 TaxID=3346786 RepID=UPI0036843ACC